MNQIGLVALLSAGIVYGAHALHFYPTEVTIAAAGFLAFAVFSRPSTRRPLTRLYWGD
jgi:hypothetical protein